MLILKGWQQQFLRKTNTYDFVRRAYRDAQLLCWQTRELIRIRGRDTATPAMRQGISPCFMLVAVEVPY